MYQQNSDNNASAIRIEASRTISHDMKVYYKHFLSAWLSVLYQHYPQLQLINITIEQDINAINAIITCHKHWIADPTCATLSLLTSQLHEIYHFLDIFLRCRGTSIFAQKPLTLNGIQFSELKPQKKLF